MNKSLLVKNFLLMCYAMAVTGWAEIRVREMEHLDSFYKESGAINFPNENRIGILPVKLIGYAKELPSEENYTNAAKAIASQISMMTSNSTQLLETVPPEKIGKKAMDADILAEWVKQNYDSKGIRTVLFVTLNLRPGSAPLIVRHLGVPVGYSQNQSTIWVTAIPVLRAMVFDVELGLPIGVIEENIPYVGENISSYIKGEHAPMLKNKLAEEVDRMVLGSAAYLAVECAVNRLIFQRPRISIVSMDKKQVTLAAGTNFCVNDKCHFLMLGGSEAQWSVMGRLKIEEIGAESVVCSYSTFNNKMDTTIAPSFAIPIMKDRISLVEVQEKRAHMSW